MVTKDQVLNVAKEMGLPTGNWQELKYSSHYKPILNFLIIRQRSGHICSICKKTGGSKKFARGWNHPTNAICRTCWNAQHSNNDNDDMNEYLESQFCQ